MLKHSKFIFFNVALGSLIQKGFYLRGAIIQNSTVYFIRGIVEKYSLSSFVSAHRYLYVFFISLQLHLEVKKGV